MTNILDDAYESDLTDEESEQLLLMSEHAIAPPISLAAQAVLDALNFDELNGPQQLMACAHAAALRAAAEIVAPLSYEDVWTDGRILQYEKYDPVREKLLVIADELEAL